MTKPVMPYCDKECFELAKDIRALMVRVMESSKRDTLTLAQKIIIKDVAHVLDAQSRKLVEVTE
jgi:HJR/Mrr/RecB family endonuclease